MASRARRRAQRDQRKPGTALATQRKAEVVLPTHVVPSAPPPMFVQTYAEPNAEKVKTSFEQYCELAYGGNAVVFGLLNMQVRLFSEARLGWIDEDKDVSFGPGLEKLDNPWPNGTTGELLARMRQDAAIAGNAYVRDCGGDRLERLRPDWVTIVSWVTEDQLGHQVREVIGFMYEPDGDPERAPDWYPVEEVAHWAPIPDPLANWRGMSWFTPALREINADRSMTEHREKFFRSAATPNIIIKYTGRITPQQKIGLAESIAAKHGGPDKAGGTLVLDEGADPMIVGSKFSDAQFGEVLAATENRMAVAAGVPALLAGLKEGLDAAAWSMYKQAIRAFADLFVRPDWRSACASLSTLVDVPAGKRLWFDTSDIAALADGEVETAQRMQTDAATISSLITAGFEPMSVLKAVKAGDVMLLKHTGLVSVQLLPPGTQEPAPGDVVEGELEPPAEGGDDVDRALVTALMDELRRSRESSERLANRALDMAAAQIERRWNADNFDESRVRRDDEGQFAGKAGGLDKLKLARLAPAGFSVRSSRKLKTDTADVGVADVDGPDGPQVRVGVIGNESGKWDAGFTGEGRKVELRQQIAEKQALFDSDSDDVDEDIEDQISDLESELEDLDGERTAIVPPEAMADFRRQLGEALTVAKANKAEQDAVLKEFDALDEKRDRLIAEFSDAEMERKISKASGALRSKLRIIKSIERGPNPPHWTPDFVAELIEKHRADVPGLEAELAPLLARRAELMPPDARARLEDLDREFADLNDADIDALLTVAEVPAPNGARIRAEVWGSDEQDEGWASTRLYVLLPGESTADADNADDYAYFRGLKGLSNLMAGLGTSKDIGRSRGQIERRWSKDTFEEQRVTRDRRGRFGNLVADALASGVPDALDAFDREQLRREARRRKIRLAHKAPIGDIKQALREHHATSSKQTISRPKASLPDPEAGAVARQAAIDASRDRAQFLAELDEALANGTDRPALRRMVATGLARHKDAQAGAGRVIEAVQSDGDDDTVRAAIDAVAETWGLRRDDPGAGFDPARHEPIGDKPHKGQRIDVVRPGYSATIHGETIQLSKAVVEIAVPPGLFDPPINLKGLSNKEKEAEHKRLAAAGKAAREAGALAVEIDALFGNDVSVPAIRQAIESAPEDLRRRLESVPIAGLRDEVWRVAAERRIEPIGKAGDTVPADPAVHRDVNGETLTAGTPVHVMRPGIRSGETVVEKAVVLTRQAPEPATPVSAWGKPLSKHLVGGSKSKKVLADRDKPVAPPAPPPVVAGSGTAFRTLTADEAQQMQDHMLAGAAWTDAQREAIHAYTVDDFKPMNTALRGGTLDAARAASDPVIQRNIKEMNAAMRPLPEPITVYRNTGPVAFGDLNPFELINELPDLVGQTFQERGFLSTSVTGNELEEFGSIRIKLDVPAGSRAAFVKELSNNEHEDEMVLAPGTKFRVLSANPYAMPMSVHAEVIE